MDEHHRHHRPVVGHKFSIAAVSADDAVDGVAIVGRPVARGRDDGWTLEVTHLCVADRRRDACSFLYAASARAAWALGYQSIGTYTLTSETGASLRGAGWTQVHITAGGSWSTPSRVRVDGKFPPEPKVLWEAVNGRAAVAELPSYHAEADPQGKMIL